MICFVLFCYVWFVRFLLLFDLRPEKSEADADKFYHQQDIDYEQKRKRQALRQSSIYRPGQISYANWLQLILCAALTLPRELNSCEVILFSLLAEGL